MSSASREAMLQRRPGLRPLVITTLQDHRLPPFFDFGLNFEKGFKISNQALCQTLHVYLVCTILSVHSEDLSLDQVLSSTINGIQRQLKCANTTLTPSSASTAATRSHASANQRA